MALQKWGHLHVGRRPGSREGYWGGTPVPCVTPGCLPQGVGEDAGPAQAARVVPDGARAGPPPDVPPGAHQQRQDLQRAPGHVRVRLGAFGCCARLHLMPVPARRLTVTVHVLCMFREALPLLCSSVWELHPMLGACGPICSLHIPAVAVTVVELLHRNGEQGQGKGLQTAPGTLCRAKSGVYCGPLRLLAMEVYDECNANGTFCNLTTGVAAARHPAVSQVPHDWEPQPGFWSESGDMCGPLIALLQAMQQG